MKGQYLIACALYALAPSARGQLDGGWSEIALAGNRTAWDSLRQHAALSDEATSSPWHQLRLPLDGREPWAQLNDSAAWELAQWVAPVWEFHRMSAQGMELGGRAVDLSPDPAPANGWWVLGGGTLLVWLMALGWVWRWVHRRPEQLPLSLAPLFDEHAGSQILEKERITALKHAQQLLGLQAIEENRSLRFKTRLTPAELEVAELLMAGKSVDQLAKLLACSKPHIYNVRSSIRKKLNLPNTGDLVEQLNALALPGSEIGQSEDRSR